MSFKKDRDSNKQPLLSNLDYYNDHDSEEDKVKHKQLHAKKNVVNYEFLNDPENCTHVPTLKEDIKYQEEHPNATPAKIYMKACAQYA